MTEQSGGEEKVPDLTEAGDFSPSSHSPADELEFQRAELALKGREVAVKEGELLLKRQEATVGAWRSPLVLSVLGAALAAGGNAAVSYVNAKQARELEDRKSEQARILEMIKTGSPDKAAENLKFLVDAGLISDDPLLQRLTKFLRDRQPGTGPSLPSPSGNSIAERIARAAEASSAPVQRSSGKFYVLNHVLFGAADAKPVSVVEAASKGTTLMSGVRAVVLHFSADARPGAAIGFMGASRPDGRAPNASAHVVIRRDGSVTQLVAFDVPAFHAGQSSWMGVTNLNRHSIGIMFENRGRLQQVGGKWPVPDDQLFVTGSGENRSVWERYTEEQVRAAGEVVRALGEAYPSIEAVLRHSDISSGRREDPGPALDIAPLTSALQNGKMAGGSIAIGSSAPPLSVNSAPDSASAAMPESATAPRAKSPVGNGKLEERVRRIVTEQLSVPYERTVSQAEFEKNLGASSLDCVELRMAFEDQFNIEIPDEDGMRIRTVGDAIAYIKQKSESKTLRSAGK